MNYEKMIDPEVKEYFKEFTHRNWSQAQIARRIGISQATICTTLLSGRCTDKVKILLEKLYRNPDGNFSNLDRNTLISRESERVLQEQAMARIKKYIEEIDTATKKYQEVLEKLVNATKKDFLGLSMQAKKSERRLLSTIKNRIKPSTLVKNRIVEDMVSSAWEELDELMIDMSESNRISDV